MRFPSSFDATLFFSLSAAGQLLVPGSAAQKAGQQHEGDDRSSSSSLVYLNHTEAYGMLANGGETAAFHDFYAAQRGCDAQVNQFYCAAASTACLLNSLGDDFEKNHIPVNAEYDTYAYAVDVDLLNPLPTAAVDDSGDASSDDEAVQ